MYKGLTEILAKHKESLKIAVKSKNETLNYKDLFESSVEKANAINLIDLKQPNIAIALPNSIVYIQWFCAVSQSESVVVPLNFNSSVSEIENCLNSCDVSIFVSTKEMLNKIRPFNINHKMYTIEADSLEIDVINADLSISCLCNSCTDDETFMISVASESADNSSQVMLSKKNIFLTADAIIESLHYNEDEVFLVCLPFCFVAICISQLIASLILGATIYLFNEYLHPRNIAKIIEKEKITTLFCLTSFLKSINQPRLFNSKHPKTLKTICFSGENISNQTIKSTYENDCFEFVECVFLFSQNESSTPITYMTRSFFQTKPNSIGKPLKRFCVAIVNDEFEFQAAETLGEIAVLSDYVMQGYYKMPQKTDKIIKSDWILTGNIGKIDNEGFVYIAGKKKNIITSRSTKIYPEEIENVISMISGVNDVVVFGKPDDKFGEVCVANVVLAEGEFTNKSQILSFCKQFLPEEKVPCEIIFSNKIVKTKLKKVHETSLSDV